MRLWRRVPRGVKISAAFLAFGLLVAFGVSRLALREVIRYEPVDRVLVSADGLTLAGTVPGCSSGRLEVDESPASVTVRLRTYPVLLPGPPGMCKMESYTAQLRSPLGSRRLVDGVSRHAVPAFDGNRILRPAHLPDGYAHRYDTASFPEETVVGSRAGCVQLYTTEEGYDEAILITQDADAHWQPPDRVTEEPITVRGHPGTAIPGEIEWTENGELFTIQSRTYPYATLSTAQLVAIADSMG